MASEAVDDDPIVESYNIVLNPSLPGGRRLWVLQQPNRTDLNQAPPSAMRLKSRAGMVEVDIPLDYQRAYDRDKGMHWGRHLKNSVTAKGGGSHGLAGGFGVGAAPQRSKKRDEERDEDIMMDWTEALRQDKVLRTQTMGGTCPDSKEVQHMIGVIQGGQVHITPVSDLVHLRPHLHHVDAVTYQERQSSSAAAAKEAGGGGGQGGAGTGQNPVAKAIQMTIKQGGDNDAAASTETMMDRLRAVQAEKWHKLRCTDENDEAAWEVYNESFILPGSSSPDSKQKAVATAAADKGGEEPEENDAANGDNDTKMDLDAAKGDDNDKPNDEPSAVDEDLAERVKGLTTGWQDDQLLEKVSRIIKPKIPTKAELKQRAEEEAAAEARAAKVKADADAKRAASRARGGGTAMGRARPSRGRVGRGGSAAAAMDLT